MDIAQFSSHQWLLAAIAAFCIGLSKTGFGGVGTLAVLLIAMIMPAQQSTGFVLPLLIFADIFAVTAFRKHAQWSHVWRLTPPAIVGVIAAYAWMEWMDNIPDAIFKPLIGWIVLVMVVLQMIRTRYPDWMSNVPESRAFGWTMGGLCGVTTMLANAAGPVAAMYLLAMKLPKWELIGTGAWYFLMVNIFKVPFSLKLGLINGLSLATNFVLIPAILLGVGIGRYLIKRIPQKLFETLLLAFAAIAAVRLIIP